MSGGIPKEIHAEIWQTLETLAKFLKEFLDKSLEELFLNFPNKSIKKSFMVKFLEKPPEEYLE